MCCCIRPQDHVCKLPGVLGSTINRQWSVSDSNCDMPRGLVVWTTGAAAANAAGQRVSNTPAAEARPAQGLAGEAAALAELEAAVSSVQELHDATTGLRSACQT